MNKKRILVTLISCLLIASFLVSGTAYAQEDKLPDPGMTPDSPFYFLDNWGKSLGMAFAFGAEAKAKKALEYAEERLAEAEAMAAKNRTREMVRAAESFNGFMAMVAARTEEAAQEGTSDNISENVASTATRIHNRLDALKDKLPKETAKDVDPVDEELSEEAASATEEAEAATINAQVTALSALAKINPERALELTDEAIENRLERARVKTTENVTAAAESAIADAASLAAIEDEITELAAQLGQYSPEMEQRLAHATANRLEVLAGVYENAPETARQAIENAMENSVRKYERAVEALQQENTSDNTSLQIREQEQEQELQQEQKHEEVKGQKSVK